MKHIIIFDLGEINCIVSEHFDYETFVFRNVGWGNVYLRIEEIE